MGYGRVVTTGSVIYIGSQIGVFTEILVTYPRIKARARQGTVHRFFQVALPQAEVSADTINGIWVEYARTLTLNLVTT